MSTLRHEPRVDAVKEELVELARQYFNGPYVYPNSRVVLGRRLRRCLLDLDIVEASVA